MRQKIIKYFLIVLSFYLENESFSKMTHSQMIKKYPFGLLGDDFNILSIEDLESNACMAKPVLFTKKLSAYPYWQCFETQKTKLFCDGYMYDEEVKDFFTTLVVEGTVNNVQHVYVGRKALSFELCKDLEKKWNKLTKNENHVCISGPFTSIKKQKNNQESFLWTFDKFKTKKGCAAYFYGDCSLKYQLKSGCEFQE